MPVTLGPMSPVVPAARARARPLSCPAASIQHSGEGAGGAAPGEEGGAARLLEELAGWGGGGASQRKRWEGMGGLGGLEHGHGGGQRGDTRRKVACPAAEGIRG